MFWWGPLDWSGILGSLDLFFGDLDSEEFTYGGFVIELAGRGRQFEPFVTSINFFSRFVLFRLG